MILSTADSFAPLHGVILAGGRSRRMGSDKANLVYETRTVPQWKHLSRLLGQFCETVHLSIRAEQQLDDWSSADGVPVLDGSESKGPISGIVTVAKETQAALLVVACDLPLLTTEVLEALIKARGAADCIAFKSSTDGLPEPLCTIYERPFTATLETALNAGQRCPRRILINNPSRVHLLELLRPNALDNANSPEDLARISAQLKDSSR